MNYEDFVDIKAEKQVRDPSVGLLIYYFKLYSHFKNRSDT